MEPHAAELLYSLGPDSLELITRFVPEACRDHEHSTSKNIHGCIFLPPYAGPADVDHHLKQAHLLPESATVMFFSWSSPK